MKKNYFYLAVAILTFAVGTFFAIYFYSQKIEPQIVLQNETMNTPSKQILQPETQAEKTSNFINFDELKIKGIGLNSTENEVVKEFGKPQKVRNNGFNECAEFYEKTLFYEGMKLNLLGNKNRKYKVYLMEVSSPKLVTVSGIKIADDIKDVFSKFGEVQPEGISSVTETLHYGNDVGWARFSFQNNKLVRIWFEHTLC